MRSWFRKIKEDFRNYNRNNTSEKQVLQSHFFSCYRGKLVIRTHTARSGSFGILFISRNAGKRSDPIDLVRHEYGHTRQLDLLGVVKYLLCIGLPSWREWGSEKSYYDRPWEITADLFGGVTTRVHKQEKIEAGEEYLRRSKQYGRKIWKEII